MKNTLVVLILCFATLALAQETDKYAAFSARKQSVDLPTGITLKYIDAGPRKGTPLVLLHGYTDSGRSFQQVIEALRRENKQLRLIVPDLRGHGESSMPDAEQCKTAPETCFSMTDFAADVAALLDHLDVPSAHIAGHSMGSAIAQELALSYPGRVNSLTLIGAFVNGQESATIRDFLMTDLIEGQWRSMLEKRPGFQWPADAWALTPMDMPGEVFNFLKDFWVMDPVAEDDFIQAILPETANTRLGTWIGAIKALAQVDYRAALRNLNIPTLILWATQDNMFTEEPDQRWVKEAFRAANAATGVPVIYKTYGKTPLPASGQQVNELGHNLHFGAPNEVAADIASFVQKGAPVRGTPYANPHNIKQVVTEASNDNIGFLGKKGYLKK